MIPLKDLTGLKFNRFTVIRKSKRKYRGCALWVCRCECGNIRHIMGSFLKGGIHKGCGCKKKKDMTGMKLNHWTVLRKSKKYKHKILWWLCKCDCGTIRIVSGNALRMGSSKSCGCAWIKHLKGKAEKDRELVAFRRMYYGILRFNKNYGVEKNKNLSFDDFLIFSKSNCHYCNLHPSNKYKDQAPPDEKNIAFIKYSGLDQIRPAQGYTIDNVVPCCINCNIVKNDLSQHDFQDLVKRIYTNWAKGPIESIILVYMHSPILGKKLGKLTISERTAEKSKYGSVWLCKCECGDSLLLNTNQIRNENGRITSCGCEKNLNYKFNRKEFAIMKRLYGLLKFKNKNKKGNILHYEKFEKLCYDNCFYCGNPPGRKVLREQYQRKKNKNDDREFIYVNGIDRINSHNGYTETNVRSCCRTCNLAKNDLSEDEFKQLIINIYHHWACK